MNYRELDKQNSKEVNQLAELVRLSQHYQRLELEGGIHDEAFHKATNGYLARSLDHPGYTYIVAEDEGSVVGFIHLQATLETMYIEDLYIDPLHREHGAASGLLEAAVQKAIDRGVKRLRLAVHEDNATAHQMYLKAGFHQVESTYLDMEKTLQGTANIDISEQSIVYEYDVSDKELDGFSA